MKKVSWLQKPNLTDVHIVSIYWVLTYALWQWQMKVTCTFFYAVHRHKNSANIYKGPSINVKIKNKTEIFKYFLNAEISNIFCTLFLNLKIGHHFCTNLICMHFMLIMSFICLTGVAGMCSKTAVAPLDRMKILLQAHQTHYKHLGVFSGLLNIVKKESFIALYKGNGAQMVRIFPYAATQFTAFEFYKKVGSTKIYIMDSIMSI